MFFFCCYFQPPLLPFHSFGISVWISLYFVSFIFHSILSMRHHFTFLQTKTIVRHIITNMALHLLFLHCDFSSVLVLSFISACFLCGNFSLGFLSWVRSKRLPFTFFFIFSPGERNTQPTNEKKIYMNQPTQKPHTDQNSKSKMPLMYEESQIVAVYFWIYLAPKKIHDWMTE